MWAAETASTGSRKLPGFLGWTVQGKIEKSIIVLQAVTDEELWIWACRFGKPGRLNDVNILDSSYSVSDILQEKLLPRFDYTLNRKKRKELYF